ncbi:hypothetical protein ABT081_02460 [Streptomyces sp. NPDC002238]|uniref:hypothetical protein n=1 Tax=Streptomyces sp. NPDC002238 TaxID=3156649 RepID=UPI00331D9254
MHQDTPRNVAQPAVRYLAPTRIVPAAEQHLAPAPPPGMRVTGYVRIDGMLHPQYGPLYEPVMPLAPPAQPARSGLDPQAQRIAAWGVLATGVGVGSYFGMQALALALDSLVQVLIAAAVVGAVWSVPTARHGGRETPTYITNNRGMLAGWKAQNGPRT